MLKDTYGRRHTYLRISVTDRCNLQCKYCMPPQGFVKVDRELILHPEEIGRLAALFASEGIAKIRLTGGEPLLRKGFDQILVALAPRQSDCTLAVTTNGLLLKRWVDPLAECGFRRINISLDTLSRSRFEKITGLDAWQDVWDGLVRAIKHPVIEKVKINVVLQKDINDDEMEDFARLTMRYPIDVRFIELMPTENVNWHKNHLVTSQQVLTRLSGLYELEVPSRKAKGPASLYQFPNAPGRIGLISSISHPACAECNRLRLTAQGSLLSCLFNSSGLDLRTMIRNGCSDEEIIAKIKQYLAQKREGGINHLQQNGDSFSPCIPAVGG